MALLRAKAAVIEMTIHAMDVLPEHAHLVIETDPRWCGAEIAASHVFREVPHLRSRLPTLWSRSYFAATVGSVTETAVRNDIANQQGT